MRRFAMGFGLIAASTFAAGCASLFHKSAPVAQATVMSASGASLGVLSFTPTSAGVHITGELKSLTAGQHGIHIHAVGKCDPAGFTTAGGHFNPASMKHGLLNPAGPHAGDMDNITVGAGGDVDVDLTTPRITLDAAANTGVFDADGAAIVVHAGPDDQKTDPAGNSGARVACGIIRKL